MSHRQPNPGPGAAEPEPSTLRTLGSGILILAAGLLIGLGLQRWLDHRAAADAVESFLDAVRKGERDRALSLLAPDQRVVVERRIRQGARPFQIPERSVRLRIRQVQISGDRAQVHLRIEKSGFGIEPIIHLQRSPADRWKIARIENLRIDPRWERRQRERARSEGRELADELSEVLNDRPGVEMERVRLEP